MYILKLTSLLAELPKLRPDELATVKAAAEHLLGAQHEAPDSTTPLYDALTSLLGNQMPYGRFKLSASWRMWARNAPTVVTFIDKNFPKATKVARLALMKFIVETLIAEMRERKIPVTVGSVTNNLTRCPEVFEMAFPDYIESGLQHLVLKAMEKKK